MSVQWEAVKAFTQVQIDALGAHPDIWVLAFDGNDGLWTKVFLIPEEALEYLYSIMLEANPDDFIAECRLDGVHPYKQMYALVWTTFLEDGDCRAQVDHYVWTVQGYVDGPLTLEVLYEDADKED